MTETPKRLALLAATVALQACGDAAGPSLDDTVAASIEIEAAVVALESGDKAQFTAVVRDVAGRVKPGITVSWSVSDAAVLGVTSIGEATAQPVSAATESIVIATHGSLADSSTVSVVPLAFPTRRRPILFIHGFGGSSQEWLPVIARFRNDGWYSRELVAATYSSTVSNVHVAAVIDNRVDSVRVATGWDQVHIVAFSMGSLSSRYYLKELGGTEWVESWTSVSGPNHGTSTANLCSLVPCIEMRPNSSFLTLLNAGDETPGEVRYGTWWSPCDDVVSPPSSTVLSGAQNTQTACLTHASMFTEANYQQVRDFIHP